MSSHAERHVEYHLLYKIINAPVRPYPFPHFYAEEVFPAEFYREMMASFPAADHLRPIGEERPVPKDAYPNRFMIMLEPAKLAVLPAPQRRVWERVGRFFLSQQFAETLLWKFGDTVKQRLAGVTGVNFRSEAMLVDDRVNYVLGPHSDNQKKVVTLLFYLPDDNSQPELGTSIYVPNDPNFRCAGGPEYPFEGFQRVATMPYRANTLFAFAKTDNSFHGVERVGSLTFRRKLMLFDVYMNLPGPAAKPESPSAPKARVTFEM
jgi:hypothetical protein